MIFISNNSKLKDRRRSLRNNQTQAEKILWAHISAKKINNLKFRRQHSFGPYILDFYCREKNLVIEIDGDSHFADEAKQYDLLRTTYLNSLNIKVIRFTNEEIEHDLDNVLNTILNLP